MPSRDTFRALERLPIIKIKHTVYRHVAPDRPCRSGEGARALGGRWNSPGSFPALYTALTARGAYLEFARRAEIQALSIETLLPRTLCVLDVQLNTALDLASDTAIDTVGLTTRHLSSPDMARCRDVGDTAHQLGIEGIIVPAATGTGPNLVIFLRNLRDESAVVEREQVTWRTLLDLPTA